MKSSTLPLSPEKAVGLANEFAAVNVQLKLTPERALVMITDSGTGCQASLDPVAALPPDYKASSQDNSAAVILEVDLAANGPRLKITHAESGAAVFLDALQLSDAAVTGAWGKFPPQYEDMSV
jgi:hypothetical protein